MQLSVIWRLWAWEQLEMHLFFSVALMPHNTTVSSRHMKIVIIKLVLFAFYLATLDCMSQTILDVLYSETNLATSIGETISAINWCISVKQISDENVSLLIHWRGTCLTSLQYQHVIEWYKYPRAIQANNLNITACWSHMTKLTLHDLSALQSHALVKYYSVKTSIFWGLGLI